VARKEERRLLFWDLVCLLADGFSVMERLGRSSVSHVHHLFWTAVKFPVKREGINVGAKISAKTC